MGCRAQSIQDTQSSGINVAPVLQRRSFGSKADIRHAKQMSAKGQKRTFWSATRTPFKFAELIAFCTKPDDFASSKYTLILSCAAADRPFGIASTMSTVLNAPGRIVDPGRLFAAACTFSAFDP